jgi:hypothetical protein
MTRYRDSSTKKKTTWKRKVSRTSEKPKTTWADPTVPISKISKSKVNKRKTQQLSCWWFG